MEKYWTTKMEPIRYKSVKPYKKMRCMTDQLQEPLQTPDSNKSFLNQIRQEFMRMVLELHLSKTILTKGLFLIEEFERLHIETNMLPKSIAGILVFFLSQKANQPVSKSELCSNFNIGKHTLRSVSEKFRKDPRFAQLFEKLMD